RFGSDNASFALRGFVQEARTTSSVGVYFADFVLPRASTMSASGEGAGPGFMFDLQNVQVLKGPQGTLFGRNTTGGAVVLTPKRPSDKLEGYIEGSIGNYDMRRIQAVVNVPASDTLRIRAGVDWQQRDGWLKNVSGYGPDNFANTDYLAARLSVLWDVTEDIENYTIASFSESKPNGMMFKITDCTVTAAATKGCQQIARERPYGDYAIANSLPWAYQHMKVWQVANSTKWQAGDDLTIKNNMSYGQSILDQQLDVTGVWNPITAVTVHPNTGAPTAVLNPAYIGLGYGSSTTGSPVGGHASAQWTFTEEVQLIGTALEGKLNWQAGAYYERNGPVGVSGTQSLAGNLCQNKQQFEQFKCTDIAAVFGGTSMLSGGTNYQTGQINFQTVGLYAQGTYKFSDQFSVDAGFRYTWDKAWGWGQSLAVSYSGLTGWNTPSFSCINGARYGDGSAAAAASLDNAASCRQDNMRKSTSAPTWMIGLNFKPIEEILLYAKYSRGYRQGSISPLAAIGFQEYDAEKVDVYEAGLKASFNGAVRGTFNIAGFYNDFSNMQMQVALLDCASLPACPGIGSGAGFQPNTGPDGIAGTADDMGPLSPNPSIVNAGKAKIYGLEIEGTVQPVEGLTLSLGYSLIHTELVNFKFPGFPYPSNQGYDTLSSTPVAGDPLPYTPKYKLTIGVNYTLPVEESLGKITLGGTFIRTGSIFYGRESTAINQDPHTVPATYKDSIFAPNDPNRVFSYSPAYNLVNFSINWENIGKSPVSISAFMTNAFGKVYFDARSPGARGMVQRYYGEPRMYGLRTRFSF
ncbi:MAG: TonB-dependent receptor, partial [Novosphingobium sp.]|nr:TonB-dependent receptor [Novosphingobium sp.]